MRNIHNQSTAKQFLVNCSNLSTNFALHFTTNTLGN